MSRRTLTWPELVRYLAITLTALVLIVPMAISGGVPTVCWPSQMELPGGKPHLPSKRLAAFWCLSLFGFLLCIALWWRLGGASIIVFFAGMVIFGIAHLLTILSPDFRATLPRRGADSSPGHS